MALDFEENVVNTDSGRWQRNTQGFRTTLAINS